jgi:hypothetical protein
MTSNVNPRARSDIRRHVSTLKPLRLQICNFFFRKHSVQSALKLVVMLSPSHRRERKRQLGWAFSSRQLEGMFRAASDMAVE